MSDPNVSPISLTVDFPRSRLRIFKAVLQQLDDPQSIQLLVNPDDMFIAIHGIEQPTGKEQAHRIKMSAGNCVEITSTEFLRRLRSVAGNLDMKYSYRLSGLIIPDKRMAIFPLKSIIRIEKQVR